MAFIPFPAGTAEVLLNYTYDGIAGQNVFGAAKTTVAPWLYTELVQLTSDFFTWWNTNLKAKLPASTVLQNITAYDLEEEFGTIVVDPVVTPGSNAGTAVANQVAMVVTLQSNTRGRSFRGRCFISGLPTSALADQKLWASAQCTSMNSAFQALNTVLATHNTFHAILSREFGGHPRTEGNVVQVVSYNARVQVATQRRRLK